MKRSMLKYAMALLMIVTFAPSATAKATDSLELLLKDPEYINISVSPSGQFISLINRVDDRNTLIVLDRETMKPVPQKSVRYEKKTYMEVIRSEWLSDNILVYTVEYEDGKYRPFETNDMFLLHMDKDVNERVWYWQGRKEKRMSKTGKKIRGVLTVISSLPDQDDKILVGVSSGYRKDGGVRSVAYTMNLKNGDFNKVFVGPGRQARMWANRDGTTFFSQVPIKTDLSEAYYRRVGDDSWTKISMALKAFYPRKISNDGKFVFGLTQLSDDVNASQVLVKMDVETGNYETIHDFGFVSDLRISFSAKGGELNYATWVDDKPEMKIFNKSRESSVLASFMRSFDGFNVSVTSVDDNNEKYHGLCWLSGLSLIHI